MDKQKIYFGHPINTYGTDLEKKLLEEIVSAFSDWEIVNPGEEFHQEGCRRWKEKTGNGMGYFLEELIPRCQAGVFLAFRDGKWGAGIFGEAEALLERKCPIFEINEEGLLSSVTASFDEVQKRALSIEETRKRIRDENGNTIPY